MSGVPSDVVAAVSKPIYKDKRFWIGAAGGGVVALAARKLGVWGTDLLVGREVRKSQEEETDSTEE